MLHRAAFSVGGYNRANRLVTCLAGQHSPLKCLSPLPSIRAKSSSSSLDNASDVANRVTQEPFLNGSSSGYLESMYNSWVEDPKSVHVSWGAYFANNQHVRPPTTFPGEKLPDLGTGTALSTEKGTREIDDHLSVQAIIRSYQVSLSTLVTHTHNCTPSVSPV